MIKGGMNWLGFSNFILFIWVTGTKELVMSHARLLFIVQLVMPYSWLGKLVVSISRIQGKLIF